MTPEISISQFLETAKDAAVVEDIAVDYNRGSDYESLSGPNAILWSRQSQRDTDLFRAVRFNDAEGQELTRLIEGRWSILRVKDTRGTGQAYLRRASFSGGAGTVWKGSRIRLQSTPDAPFSLPRYYRVTQDTVVGATELFVVVPIEAVVLGPGSRADSHEALLFEDTLWDSTWTVEWLRCSDGTALESAPNYRSRTRQALKDSRVGQLSSIEAACTAAGAQVVVGLRSDYAGFASDYGLNYLYVGDLGYTATPELVRACTLALRGVRVAGDNLQVLSLSRVGLSVDIDIFLRDSPQALPIERLELIARRAIQQYMNGESGRFDYTVSGFESAIAKTNRDIQDVRVILPIVDAGITLGRPTLPRYFVEDNNIMVRFYPPE